MTMNIKCFQCFSYFFVSLFTAYDSQIIHSTILVDNAPLNTNENTCLGFYCQPSMQAIIFKIKHFILKDYIVS